MNKTYKTIISLMNSFIYNKAFSIEDNASWKEIYYYSKIHSIAGIVGHALNTYYLNSDCVDDKILSRFKEQAIKDFGKMTLRYDQGLFIDSALSENKIDHVIFKGFVLREYYPVKELRVFGDIDILIKLKDRQKADEVMKNLGFETLHDWEPSFSYRKSISYIEIHTDLLDTDISTGLKAREYFKEDTYKNIIRISDNVYEFNKEFHLIFLIVHIAKHCSSGGAGIKMFLDLALMIKNESDLDWNKIELPLREMGMWHFASFVFAFLKEFFQIDIPVKLDMITHDQLKTFADYVFEAGTFGQHKRDSGSVQLMKSDTSKVRTVIRRFFPSAKSIEKRYTYLAKYPFLLPVAWVHRGILNISKLKYFLNKNKQVLSANTEETERLKAIQTMIGL